MSDLDFEALERAARKAEEITPLASKPSIKAARKKEESSTELFRQAVSSDPKFSEDITPLSEPGKVVHVGVTSTTIPNTTLGSLCLILKNRKKRKDNDLR